MIYKEIANELDLSIKTIEREQYIADESAWASQKLMTDLGSPQYSQLLKG